MRSPPPECCRRGEGECAHAREWCGQTQRDGERCTSAHHRWGGEKSECDGSQRVRDGAHVAARNRAPGSTRGNAGAYALPAVRGARRAVLADIRAPHARLRPRALLVRPGRSRASPPTRPIHRHRRGGARVGHALPRASQRACAEWRTRPRLRPPTSQTSQPGWARHRARATRRATPRGTQQRCAAPRHPSRAPRRRWGAQAPAACPTPLPTPGTLPRVHTPARPPALDRCCQREHARARKQRSPRLPHPPRVDTMVVVEYKGRRHTFKPSPSAPASELLEAALSAPQLGAPGVTGATSPPHARLRGHLALGCLYVHVGAPLTEPAAVSGVLNRRRRMQSLGATPRAN